MEYPTKIPSSLLVSNFIKLFFPLLWTKHLHPKGWKEEILGLWPLNNSLGVFFNIGWIRQRFSTNSQCLMLQPKNFGEHYFHTSLCVPYPLRYDFFFQLQRFVKVCMVLKNCDNSVSITEFDKFFLVKFSTVITSNKYNW